MIICRVCLGYKKHVEASTISCCHLRGVWWHWLFGVVLCLLIVLLDLIVSVIFCDISKTLLDHL